MNQILDPMTRRDTGKRMFVAKNGRTFVWLNRPGPREPNRELYERAKPVSTADLLSDPYLSAEDRQLIKDMSFGERFGTARPVRVNRYCKQLEKK